MCTKIKYGVVGVGIIGRVHVDVAAKLKETELVAIADVNIANAKAVAEKYHVRWYQNYVEMLEKEKLDAISICTPHNLHYPIAMKALEYNTHVLVEKPMALSVKEADEMIAKARRLDLKLGVVFQHRTKPLSISIKRLIEEGKLGELYRALLEYCTYRDQRYYRSGPWRGTWKGEGGGVLINQAIHFIDLFQWFIGKKPSRLAAFINTLTHEIEVEDLASAVIEFEGGTQGVIHVSSFDMPSFARFDIRGDNGIIVVEDNRGRIAWNKPPIKESIISSLKERAKPIVKWEDILPSHIKESGHQMVIKDFALAIINDQEPMVNGEEGRKSLEIVNAIILSGIKNKIVKFPVDRHEYEKLLTELSELKHIPQKVF